LKYGKQYETAGFPTIQQAMTEAGIHRMIFAWILMAAVSGPMLLVDGFLRSLLSAVLIPVASLWLIFIFLHILKRQSAPLDYARYFKWINGYFLACVLLMISDPFAARLLGTVL
jgi:protoheme IX farnesyltransferase